MFYFMSWLVYYTVSSIFFAQIVASVVIHVGVVCPLASHAANMYMYITCQDTRSRSYPQYIITY